MFDLSVELGDLEAGLPTKICGPCRIASSQESTRPHSWIKRPLVLSDFSCQPGEKLSPKEPMRGFFARLLSTLAEVLFTV